MSLEKDLVDDFLEHHGVKGMKWGVRHQKIRAAKGPNRFGNRNNARAQRHLDRYRMVASGKATLGTKFKAALDMNLAEIVAEGGLQGASAARLDRGKRYQAKVKSGKKVVSDMLGRLEGVDVRELHYNYTKPKNP